MVENLANFDIEEQIEFFKNLCYQKIEILLDLQYC
jgi:hypothetical protein